MIVNKKGQREGDCESPKVFKITLLALEKVDKGVVVAVVDAELSGQRLRTAE